MLEIKKTARIVELGCGKGAAMITLAKFPFARITEVKISQALIETAQTNLALVISGRRRHDIELCRYDATDLRDLDDFNFVYFFNPFKAPVMRAVIENLGASLTRNPRRCTIIYWFPTCHDVLVSGGFEKVREFNHGPLPIAVYVNREAARNAA